MDKHLWTSPVTIHNAAVTLSGLGTALIDLDALGLDMIKLGGSVGFGATAATGCQVDVYGSSDGGVTFHSVPLYTATIAMATSATAGIGTTLKDEPYLRVVFKNLDATQPVNVFGSYVGHYAYPNSRLV